MTKLKNLPLILYLLLIGCYLCFAKIVIAEEPKGDDLNSVCCDMPATHVVKGECCNGPNDARGKFSDACCEGYKDKDGESGGTVKTVNGKKICCKNKNPQPS